MKCEKCAKDYPSIYYFKTRSICTECYKKKLIKKGKESK